jgi:hypothetical protein
MRRHRQLSSTPTRPRWGTRSRAILTLLVSGLLVAGAAVPAQAASASSAAKAPAAAFGCDQMVGQKVLVTGDVARVASATAVAASGATSAYCEVQGTIGAIRFTMRLPIAAWNGRYFQTGCGGFCGAVPIASCGQALTRGFAVAAEDTGHVGTQGNGIWAYNNRRAEIDFGYRSPHLMAQAGKALTERFYGQAPSYSYFQGCSTGGRHALSEAQRYPDDFDGIIAGAPAL